ncbi:MAG: hypothetical protein ABH828_05995 [archaeon]
MFEVASRVRDYFRFSLREQKEIIISAIIFGFILSFRKWGVNTFDLFSGLSNWIIASILILIVMLANLSVQKIFALSVGARMHYSWWFQGMLIGLFISFVSYGTIPFLFPGTTYFEHMEGLRLGQFRYKSGTKEMALASVAGVVTNVLLALIFSFLYLATNSHWVLYFIGLNFLYGFYSMLPVPRIAGTKMGEGATAGFHIFFFGRPLYIFIFSTLILYCILLYVSITFFGGWLTLFLAAVLGLIAMFFFLKFAQDAF